MGWIPITRKELEVAVKAVRLACQLCEGVRRRLIAQDTIQKGDRSPVTVADFGSQAVVNHLLRTNFPEDPIVAEEDARALRSEGCRDLLARVSESVREVLPRLGEAEMLEAIDSGRHAGGSRGRFWTVDPIDGTKGFLRGDQYAVALALIEDGNVVLGVLGCPRFPQDTPEDDSRGALFAAVGRGGAWKGGLDGDRWEAIHVSAIDDPAMARFCESVESAHSSHGHSEEVARLLGIGTPPLRMDSQAKYAAVAEGDASIYLRLPTRSDYREKIWDHAAGWVIVKEAGGEVTDVLGAPLDFSRGRTLSANLGVVATNARIHGPVVGAVRRVLAG